MTKRREMAKTVIISKDKTQRGHNEIQLKDHTRNGLGIRQLKKVRRTQKLGQDTLITLLDKQLEKSVIARIEEFYSKQYDNDQRTIIHPKEIPQITS